MESAFYLLFYLSSKPFHFVSCFSEFNSGMTKQDGMIQSMLVSSFSDDISEW